MLLTNIAIENIPITLSANPTYEGVVLVCPFCRHVLSAGIDPIALKADLRNEILNALRR